MRSHARRKTASIISLVAAVAVLIVPLSSQAAVKSWSGTIDRVTATDPTNGLSNGPFGTPAIEPMDPSDSRNGDFSIAVNVSPYSDGHYQVKVRADRLNGVSSPGHWKVDIQIGDIIRRVGRFGEDENWSLTTCIQKDAKWLRLAQSSYVGYQENVRYWIDVVSRNTTACP